MATLFQSVTSTPTAVTGLSNGRYYSAQATNSYNSPPSAGLVAVFYVTVTDGTSVTRDTRHSICKPLDQFLIRPVAGETTYVWVGPEASTALISIDEVG